MGLHRDLTGDDLHVNKLHAGTHGRGGTDPVQVLYNVVDYGATGGLDDSAAFQAAIDAAHAAGGGTVYIPNGTWIVKDLASYGGVYIEGESWNALIKKKSDGAQIIVIDSGSTTLSEEDIKISNCAFEGLSVDVGFFEFHHILVLHGVSDLIIDHVKMTEFEGDAIILTEWSERHNKRVTIRNSFFDGVNKDNRQAISVLDCDDLTIEGNYFTRTTRPNMPGAIDIEPEFDFDIITNVKIRNNSFYDIGGGSAAINIYLPPQSFPTTKYNGFIIEGNYFDTTSNAGLQFTHANVTPVVNTDPFDDVVFSNNKFFNVAVPFSFGAVKGIIVENNEAHESAAGGIIGVDPPAAARKCQDVTFRNNVWDRLGTSVDYGIAITNVERLSFDHDKFIDCGKTDGSQGYGIVFFSGAVASFVSIINTEFSKPNSKMTEAVTGDMSTLTDTNWGNNSVESGLVMIFPTVSRSGPPCMTTAQRDAIASPTEGMVIFNTTTHVLNFYYTSWTAV